MKLQLWAVKEVIKRCTGTVVLIGILTIIKYALQPITLYLYKTIISDLENIQIYFVIIWIFLLLVIEIGGLFLDTCSTILEKKLQLNIDTKFYDDVWKNAECIDVYQWEKNEFMIKIGRIKKAVESNFASSITMFFSVIGISLSLLVSIVMIIQTNIVYFWLFILMGTFQNVFLFKYNLDYVELIKKQEPFQRKHDYFANILKSRKYIKELRILQIEEWLEKKRSKVYYKTKDINMKFSAKWTITNLIWALGMYVIEGIFYLIIIVASYNGKMGVDDAVFLIQSQLTVINLISSLLQIVSSFSKEGLYLNEYRSFTKTKENKTRKTPEYSYQSNLSVKVENLNYQYSDERVLKDINISIKRGEKVAILGENGSGKSTLAKLILGLLQPTTGNIILFHDKKSAVFQDYAHFYTTVRENIALGNIEFLNKDSTLYEMIKNVTVDEQDLDNYTLDTKLGTEYFDDAIDLSGGQWQKLAYIRSIIRQADLLIFDEATSALDAVSELKQYKMLKNMLKEKTIIIITHRVGIAREMNNIIYLENGRVVETGNHEKLMDKKGKYFDLYTTQAEWYLEENKSENVIYD